MLRIEEVADPKGLNAFVDLPFRLYRSDPNWVPPLKSEVRNILDPKKNPFWQHSTGKLYLAVKNGVVVGRIAAMVDQNFIQFHGEKSGYFGFFESVDDFEVASALFEKAVEFNRGHGMERFYGPMNPSTNDEVGFLVDGFDTPPYVMMTHTHKYYLELAERFGFKKGKDLYAFYVEASDAPMAYLERITRMVKHRLQNLIVRPVRLREFGQEVRRIKEVYNDAWSRNWGFVPMTDAEFDDMAKRLKSLVVADLVLIAELDGKPVGVSLAVPNYNEVLKDLGGRLGPIEIIKFLFHRKKIKGARLMIMGVRKDYRKAGIEAIFFLESFKAAVRLGYTHGELSWTLEDNDMVNRPIMKMGAKVYKTYRVYQYDIK